jgi:hypothetical protein
VLIPGPNVALVAAVFLAVLFLGDVLWAAFASSARRVLSRCRLAQSPDRGFPDGGWYWPGVVTTIGEFAAEAAPTVGGPSGLNCRRAFRLEL